MTREEYLRFGFEIGLLKFSEYLELTKPLNLPEGLEEAADKYAHSLGYDEEKDRVEIAAAKDDFIAGVEWQKKQDQQLIELAEDHAMLAGMNRMKEEMMEKAVEGEVSHLASVHYVKTNESKLFARLKQFKPGDKVKVIVIPDIK